MNSKEEFFLETLNNDCLKLLISRLSPQDFFAMQLVCRSWKEYLTASTLGQEIAKITTSKPTKLQKLMSKIKITNNPFLLFSSTDVLATITLFHFSLNKIGVYKAFVEDPPLAMLVAMIHASLAGMVGILCDIVLSGPMERYDSTSPRESVMLEATSVALLVLAGVYCTSNMDDVVMRSLILLAIPVCSIIGAKTLNRNSLFCQNKPKELHKAISSLLTVEECLDLSAKNEESVDRAYF